VAKVELSARAVARQRDLYAAACEEYWVEPQKRKFLHQPVCECSCSPLVEKDEDMVGNYRCIRCGRPPR
jgi:hypothetical protein